MLTFLTTLPFRSPSVPTFTTPHCCHQPPPIPPPRTPPNLDTLLPTNPTSPLPSTVHLVGTGPGDPSLLTLRAYHLLQTATVVLYDRLITPSILSLINSSAKMVYVGKSAGYHTRSQQEICQLLGVFAEQEQGGVIVRLKGGDPYVFGRGGEEVEYLERKGVRVVVTPGITAAAGIGADLGIPMTCRGLASSVRYMTGHEERGKWAVRADETVVVYMGLGRLKQVLDGFVEEGLGEDTPAVAVERGCTVEQRVVWGTVKCLESRVRDRQLKSPTLVVVGAVVALAPGWKEQFGETQQSRLVEKILV